MKSGNLVISRNRGESVYIGDDIKITVVRFSGANGVSQVQLAIEAPTNIVIRRDDMRAEGGDYPKGDRP